MNFKKIELVGFKSFADRLEVSFEPGITGIVGPNGCGKSNVSDAIRWVLGEQSTKLLRGNSMQDVIFNGTEKRKSMSYCEVSLFFDNTKRFFNLDIDEVSFTRKLYRSGESEYMINSTPCRLKDIVSALHDSGIGKDGYSIIGQGKVEEIISAKPENRRAIFEEAAGISKFKTKKVEAERRLDRTQENLNRALDVLAEQERQLGPLKKQAENAKIYLEYKEKLKSLEVNLYVSQYDNASTLKNEIQTKIDGYAEELLSKQNLFDKATNDYNDKMTEISQIDRTLQTLNDQILSLTVNLEKKAGETNVLRERLKFLREEEASLNADYQKELLNKENTVALLSTSENSKVEKEKKLNEILHQLSNENESYLKVVDELTTSEDEASKRQKEMIDELSKMTDIKSNISALNAQKDAYLTNITDLEEKIYNFQKNIKEKELQLDNARKNKVEAENSYNGLLSISKDIQNKILSKENLLRENIDKLNNCASNIQILQNRKKVLEDMQRDFEGYNYSVKRLMQDSESQIELKNKIVGLVASCMSIPNGFETAVEVALGGAVQDIITKNEDDSKFLINYLKRNNLGRATFLPISSMKIRLLSDQEKSVLRRNKTYGVACDVVKYDASLKTIFESLLGRTVIVANIDDAVSLAKQSNFSFKIVTIDGDVINPQGSISGGSKKAITSNLLSRENEIENISGQISKISTTLEEVKILKKQLEKELEVLRGEKKENDEKIVVAQIENAKQSQNYDQLSIFVDELNKERISLSQEKIDYATKVEVITKAISSAGISGAEESLGSSVEIENNQKIFASLRARRDEIQNEITELKVQKSTVESELVAINAEIQRLEEYNSQLDFKLIDLKNNLGRISANVIEAEKIINSQIDEVDDVETKRKIDDAKLKLNNLDKTKNDLQSEIRVLDDEKGNLMNQINSISEKKYQQEMNLAKVDTDIEAMQEKIYEDYELTYAGCLDYKVDDFDIREGSIEINRIKKEISKLGYINVNAIEDCKDLMERYEALSNQANDLSTAKEDLIKIIKDLSNEMITRFDAEFAKIQANFSKVFRELFGGGNAKLELTEAEDPLQAGVEIVAEPPGKKLQSITLLSGGEKALTAIAILFAILKLRPMPFCLLDEIEAALDDTNVSRFAQYLKNFSKETQFIVITHRKPTMMLADSLYGVTMEEKGVSKIVSVKLSDAIKNSKEEQPSGENDVVGV